MLHTRDRDRALGAADGRGDGAACVQRVGASLDERLAARVEAVRAELRAEAGLFGRGVLGGGAVPVTERDAVLTPPTRRRHLFKTPQSHVAMDFAQGRRFWRRPLRRARESETRRSPAWLLTRSFGATTELD